MTEDKKTNVFLNGFVPKAVSEKTPEFVLGMGSIHIDNMIASLEECRQYADNGWLNYQIFQSKKDPSKRYAQLNLWKPDKAVATAPQDTRFQFNKEPLPIVDVNECTTCGTPGHFPEDGTHDCIPF